MPAFRYGLVGVLLLALAIVSAASGELPLKSGDAIRRATSPGAFWFFVALTAGLGAGAVTWAIRLWKRDREE